jgi:hypothetical protein
LPSTRFTCNELLAVPDIGQPGLVRGRNDGTRHD